VLPVLSGSPGLFLDCKRFLYFKMALKTALLSVLGFVALTNASVIHQRTSKPAHAQYYNKKTSRELIRHGFDSQD
jgi:hypothetical protein